MLIKFLLRALSLFIIAEALSGASLEALTIQRQNGESVPLHIELADTPEERAVGLMHRRILPFNHGMLFDFGAAHSVSMWMKDTYIPLDMFFIDSKGIIRGIIEHTTPFSEELINSPLEVHAVLELNGGSAARFNIKVGDKINHPLFTAPP